MENLKSLAPEGLTSVMNKYSPFLNEVRKRLFFTASVFAVAMVIGFTFYEKIIKFLVDTLNLHGVNIVFTSPFQFINLAITCGVVVGLICSFPLIVSQILQFLRPALRQKEYKLILSFLPYSIFLFVVGFIFGAIIMKWQISIFLTQSVSLGIGNTLDITKLLSTILMTSSLLGVGFQFPIVLLILMRMGVIKRHKLKNQRMWVYIGSLLFAILLPIDSILADILLALPLVFLFEFTLILDTIFERRMHGA